ncbi:MAG: endonuclease III [Deltaproteobacteria bacterium]|nr:endonuclease III [Deltaproteobacteria bacterium]
MTAKKPGTDLPARLRDVSGRLAGRFGRPRRSPHRTEPVRNLILTILSQNTNDANRDRAFAQLTERFPTFPLLAAAPQEEVEEAIRTAGLARAKAKAILSALARIRRERGKYTLDFLSEMPLAEAREYLISFSGVGIKTANVVLLFSFGKEAFPVDTHILRVAKRLGLVPPSADLSRAARLLEPHVPPGEPMPLHMNMIRLGREICRPRNPLCHECPLLPVCPEGKRRTEKRGTPPR